MPYKIVKDGGQFVVMKKDGSRAFGRHQSRAKAQRQLGALYASEARGDRRKTLGR